MQIILNGSPCHTNAATHLVGDIRPQEFRHRIDTPSLRGVNIQRLFGSQRADALAIDASISDREGARMLDRADPSLALFLCGSGPRAAPGPTPAPEEGFP